MARPPKWTVEEERRLEWEWGTCSLREMARRLGRPEGGVREKARKMGLGSLARGTYSLARVAEMTGYDRGRIATAARRAGVNLSRSPRSRNTRAGQKGRHYAIDDDALDRIVAELAKHPDGGRLWRTHARDWGGKFRDGSPKPAACVGCGTAEGPHHARGRCRACYERLLGRVDLDAPRRIPRGSWEGRDPPRCAECSGTDRPHQAKGLCRRCYQRAWLRDRRFPDPVDRGIGGVLPEGIEGGAFPDPDADPGTGGPCRTAGRSRCDRDGGGRSGLDPPA